MFLRPALPQDALEVARVHVRSWQAAYRGLLPQSYLDELRPEDRAKAYDFSTDDPLLPRTVVALDDGNIRGFATTRLLPAVGSGELCALYIDPENWGRRIGVALIEAARSNLLSLGAHNASLWLLAGNQRAEKFYRADGWSTDGVPREETLWGIKLEEILYQRKL